MKQISPSLICMNLCDIKNEVLRLESLDISMLHVDIIDGRFSPDMPLGIGTVEMLRKQTSLILDAHLMSVHNEPYIDMLLEAGVDRLCFHTEFEPRPSVMLRKIKAANVKAGIAISPEVTIDSLRHLLPLCDYVLLMRIDAGYANLPGVQVYSWVDEKIDQLRRDYPNLIIELDGRIGIEEIEKTDADIFVCGTKSLFIKDKQLEENYAVIQSVIERKGNV